VLQIGVNIREARTSVGMSQDDLAKKLGVKRTTYANWEGKIEPTISVLKQIAKILDRNYIELIEGNGESGKLIMIKDDSKKKDVSKENFQAIEPNRLIDAIESLTKNNDNLISQHDKIVTTNNIIAETNRMLADQLIKERSTANDVVHTQKETVAIVKILQEHVFDLESQMTGKTVREIKQAFHNKVKEVKDPVGSKDIHAGEGK
jgi:transcriptional regulator with XRE-family HTH domain